MIEFTISRVVLCVCGVTLLAASMSVLEPVQENNESEMMDELTDSIADLLDVFEQSHADELILHGSELLPSGDHVLTVSGHIVRIHNGKCESVSPTEFGGEFTLTWNDDIVVRKSVTEGLGDLTDGGDEDIDLLLTVVDVCGCPGTAIQTVSHVERMGTVHA